MSNRAFLQFAALTTAIILLAPGLSLAQGPEVASSKEAMEDPFGPNSYIYAPGWYGPGGVLTVPGYFGPGYVGELWYWSNVSWPSRSWYTTYNAGPGGYRVFYPRGGGHSYYYSHETGVRRWRTVEPVPEKDRTDWQFPRDADSKR